MASRTQKDKKMDRSCLSCDFSHFKDSPPLLGECRKTPPRSYLEKGQTPGRFFVPVRYDDWCGQFNAQMNGDKLKWRLESIAPFLPPNARKTFADELFRSGEKLRAIEVYEQLAEDELFSNDADFAFMLAERMRETAKQIDNPTELIQRQLAWLKKSASLGNGAAAYSAAILLVNSKYIAPDQDAAQQFLGLSAKLGHPAAVKRLESGTPISLERPEAE
ncbi:MAG: hypothetical protein RLW87_22775 [Alphaproteobacteria bacterium]